MDSIKLSAGFEATPDGRYANKYITLKVGDDVTVVTNPGSTFGSIPLFGKRFKAKVTRIMGRETSPYVEVITDAGDKMQFDTRGDERGKKYNQASLEVYDAARDIAVAAEAKRADEARQIVLALVKSLPHASQVEKLVWTRLDLIPLFKDLLAKIAEPVK